jgi:hypothetical protein
MAGIVPAESERPIVARSAATERAATATSRSGWPAVAAAPATLVNEYSAGQAAGTRLQIRPGQRNVIGNDYRLNRDALRARQLGGEAEIEAITCVILDDEYHTGNAGHLSNGGNNGIWRRRSEHLTCYCGTQHAGTDITAVRRLMAAAATRHDCYLTITDRFYIRAEQNQFVGQQRQSRMKSYQPPNHIADHILRIIDKLFHRRPSWEPHFEILAYPLALPTYSASATFENHPARVAPR